MISSDQTQPTVQDQVSCFRNDEKRIYGASNLSQPVQINSDRAMVFIMIAMQVFNNETLPMLLERSWRTVHGLASIKELQLTVIHTCAFHFMRNAKEIVKKTMPSGAKSVAMWMLSLLMNRETMKDLENAVELIIIVTCSKHITDSVRSSVGKLNNVLKCFKDDISSEGKKYIET